MHLIGYLAGTFTLIGFLPQTYKTIRTRNTKGLSLSTFFIVGAGAALWTAYGVGLHTPVIWVTNGIVATCCLIITMIKLSNKGR
jgi:MtN3 and saliva related transmembrane protein